MQADISKSNKAQLPKIEDLFATGDDFDFENAEADQMDDASSLTATLEHVTHYNKFRNEKPYRKQLHILIAEDFVFSQKLLAGIIRGARNQAGESPSADIVATAREAWNLFLKKAPDICFVDLRLADGSGHTLARAMKEVDPLAYIIVVTANNFEEEIAVARQNNVDGFIVKPYTKKQILDAIEKYKTIAKAASKHPARFGSCAWARRSVARVARHPSPPSLRPRR